MANTETELKLSCCPEDMEDLLAHPLLRSPSGRKPLARHQISRYFDTEDDALARGGLSLRVRTIGKKHFQTVKTTGTGGAGFSARGEWEAPVPEETPNPELIADWGLAGDFAKATGGRPLLLRFETDVRRATRMIKRPEGAVEIAVDRGLVRAGDAEDSIAEVELELKEGAPSLLHDLALELLATLSLGLGGPSKAARGYRLLGHTLDSPDPAKAREVSLAAEMTSEKAFHAIGQSCLEHLVANASVIIDGSDPEGVHQARVAIRRLRSALSAFRPMVAGLDTDRIQGELRWLMGILGPTRDADVFRETVLPPLAETLAQEPGWQALVAHFDTQRIAQAQAARDALSSSRFTALVITTLRWLDNGDWRLDGDRAGLRAAPLGKTARSVLKKRMTKVLKRGADFDHQPEEIRHALRVQVKKVRYTLDFLAPLYPETGTKAAMKAMKRVQDVLGQSNDITVGRAKLRNAARDAGAGAPLLAFIAGWAAGIIDGDRKAMEKDALDAWTALAALAPVWKLGDGNDGESGKGEKKGKKR
ncbi:MAG: CYTH and CHAD domain-containing protein [Rhodospirillum sp.]|nr:CYTH and CHAD domain-containing protein [Rhodospirillum sp.]MCF8490208.1 CYTH and CHAD domain-containing protein [Rhodospirillum sp.]MCF8500334.1 CYTH and CHAD domain-containing protein [Rhodospirillum sp.]